MVVLEELWWEKGFWGKKSYDSKSKKDGIITSKVFLYSNEGTREKDKRDNLTKNPRAETRTDCQVHLQIKFDRGAQKYKVIDFFSEYNHPLQKPQACYLIPSQREVPEVTCIDIHLADSSGIRSKEAHEMLNRQVS